MAAIEKDKFCSQTYLKVFSLISYSTRFFAQNTDKAVALRDNGGS